MNRSQPATIAAVVVVIVMLITVTFLVSRESLQEAKDYPITPLQAQLIVLNDSNVSLYYKNYFHVEDWRVNRTTIVDGKIPDMNGTYIKPEEDVWKVEIMERSCACFGIKPIYVIEGYVSTQTGNIFNISTKKVMETSYDASTCASTQCH
ncbi:MAG: hypothetical protein H5T43_08505 [Methanomethylovorans sp.]|jgi:hypothetical protein|nr:hypothetical protein [Methanomethylovorans sp.]